MGAHARGHRMAVDMDIMPSKLFQPLSKDHAVNTYPSSLGGVDWGGGAFDPVTGYYVINVNALGAPSKLVQGEVKPADKETLEAIIANRYELMAAYGRNLKSACAAELARMKEQKEQNAAKWAQFKAAQRWLHRDVENIPADQHPHMAGARADSPVLDKLVTMREELRQLWTRTNVSAEQLVADLQAWCRRAEESGIAELRNFSMNLRAARV